MKPLTRRQRGRNGMELAEEAVHLLRMNATTALPAYYIGSLPFILGVLYFWADMSRSPFAQQHLAGGSLGLALLFLWMKFWQAVFANALRARISVNPMSGWTFRRAMKVLLVQTAIQPSAVVMLPLALLPVGLALPPVYGFYQNVTALSDDETGEISKVFKRAARLARLWPGQNYLLFLLLAGFALCALINISSVTFMLPHLLKTLLGIESIYTQSTYSMFNTTFFAAIFGLAYLCVDPVIKTVYLLRCFYGESLDSGEDLKAELKQFAAPLRPGLAVVILLTMLACAVPSQAAEAVTPPADATSPKSIQVAPPPAVAAKDLDQAINEVVRQPNYTWRMRREKIVKEKTESDGPITRFVVRAWQWIKNSIKAALKWIGNALDKLFNHHTPVTPSIPTGNGWMSLVQGIYFWLLAAIACALFIFIYRAWARSSRQPGPVASEAIAIAPDLADENIGADHLPEDGWLKLGRELLGRGELRMALRAFYFASLTYLAARNLITIAKFKSNRDYERELSRRGHALPTVLSLFGENVLVFVRSWYGMHAVVQSLVDQFLANVERMKAP